MFCSVVGVVVAHWVVINTPKVLSLLAGGGAWGSDETVLEESGTSSESSGCSLDPYSVSEQISSSTSFPGVLDSVLYTTFTLAAFSASTLFACSAVAHASSTHIVATAFAASSRTSLSSGYMFASACSAAAWRAAARLSLRRCWAGPFRDCWEVGGGGADLVVELIQDPHEDLPLLFQHWMKVSDWHFCHLDRGPWTSWQNYLSQCSKPW